MPHRSYTMECLRGNTLWNASEAVYYRMLQRSYCMEIGMTQRSYCMDCLIGILYGMLHRSYYMEYLVGDTLWNAS